MITHAYAQHDLGLVSLAVAVCAGAGLTTFTIYSHFLARGSAHRNAWVLLTGFCAGAGIWATHFVAMLAHDVGLAKSYDPVLTAASFAIAVVTTALGFMIARRSERVRIVAGGCIIGLGIAAMHFVGMYALIVPATFEWNAPLVAIAILLGVAFTVGALLAHRMQTGLRSLLSGAGLFALGTCALHFTAMEALTIVASPTIPAPNAHIEGPMLAIAVAGVTALVLFVGYVVALMDGRTMQESFSRTGELVEAAIEGLVIADSGIIVNINSRALELCGRASEELIGKSVFGHLLDAASRRRLGTPGTRPHFATPLLKADGSTIPVEVVWRRLRGLSHGDEVYAIRDLREREEAARQLAGVNETLRRSEQSLRLQNMILDDALSNMSPGAVHVRRRGNSRPARGETQGCGRG